MDLLKSFPFHSEILIVDTMTPMDDMKHVCAEFSCGRYVPRTVGNNYGDAIRTGIASSFGRHVAIMDSDSSYNPKNILRLYECVSAEEISKH